jgi:hypothetical protein
MHFVTQPEGGGRRPARAPESTGIAVRPFDLDDRTLGKLDAARNNFGLDSRTATVHAVVLRFWRDVVRSSSSRRRVFSTIPSTDPDPELETIRRMEEVRQILGLSTLGEVVALALDSV